MQSDTTVTPLVRHGRGNPTVTLLRSAAEPISGCVAIALLYSLGGTGDVALWIPELMCASTIPTRIWSEQLAAFFRRYRVLRPAPPMLFVEGGMVLATAYVCGWGPLALGVGAVLMQMHAKLHGGRIWKAGVVLTVLAAAVGQSAIALDWIDTIIPEPLVHQVAAVMLFTSLLSIASLGSRIVENERAEAARVEAVEQLARARRLESMGRLSAGIAHEINTPIQFISDNTSFLEDAFAFYRSRVDRARADDDLTFFDAEVPAALQQLTDGTGRIAAIVRAMTAFAQPEQTEPSDTNIEELIRNTITIAGGELLQSTMVELQIDPTTPTMVRCMTNEIGQVLLGLLLNAADAIRDAGTGPNDESVITVLARRDRDDVLIGVRDTGAGIPDEIRDRIFEPFFTTKAVGEGMGEGLNVAYATLERHNGSITFDTEVGKGSTFWIRLPA